MCLWGPKANCEPSCQIGYLKIENILSSSFAGGHMYPMQELSHIYRLISSCFWMTIKEGCHQYACEGASSNMINGLVSNLFVDSACSELDSVCSASLHMRLSHLAELQLILYYSQLQEMGAYHK